MNGQQYLEQIQSRLKHFYDTKDLPKDIELDFAAELNVSDEGYFLIPSLKTYSVNHNEYVYAKIFDEELQEEQLLSYIEYLKTAMKALKTTTEHMSSVFTLVIICNKAIAPELLSKYEKFKFHKDYAFTLKGWSDLALCLIDLESEKTVFNKAALKNSSYYELKK